jgi:hypothetical protein
MLAARRMMLNHVSRHFKGVSFSQGQSGDYRIWTWDPVVGTTSRALVNATPQSGTMTLTKSGPMYTGTVGSVSVSWTDTGGVAEWGRIVGLVAGPLSSSTIDNFVANSSIFTDDFNRSNGAVGNGWTENGDGTNTPLINSNALVNTFSAGANEAYWILRAASAAPTSVQFDLSGPPNSSGGFCHIMCGVSGLTL